MSFTTVPFHDTGLYVLDHEPTVDGGQAIHNNFKTVATNLLDNDPTPDDDVDEGYLVGCRWINKSSLTEWVCTSNSPGAADWLQLSVGGILPDARIPFRYKNVLFMKRAKLPDIFLPGNDTTGTTGAAGFVGLPTGTYSGSSFSLNATGPFVSIANNAGAFTTTGTGVLSTPIVSAATDNITLECWFRPATHTAAAQLPIYYGATTDGYGIIGVHVVVGAGICAIFVGPGVTLNSSVVLNVGDWYHLAARRLSGTWSLWINGVSQSLSGTLTTAPTTPTGSLWVGNLTSGNAGSCSGGVCNAAQYSYALTDEEIKAPYQAYLDNMS